MSKDEPYTPTLGKGMKLVNVQRGRIYDTVLVDLPASRGTELAMFRDLADKDSALTSLTTPRRLPSGVEAAIDKVEATFTPWSGDELQHLLRMFGSLHIKVNQKVVVNLPLRDLWTAFKTDFYIGPNDDINGKLYFEGSPWNAPSVEEWKHFVETEDEQLVLPGPLARFNPLLRRSRTVTRAAPRPKRGSVLVTVSMEGMLKRPEGV